MHRIAYNKFYVDELYEAIILKPFRWTARFLYEVVDRFLIDLIIVNGSAYIVDVCGRLFRRMQNGQVHRYLAALVIGGALIFYVASKPNVDFEVVQGEGGVVQLAPDVGAGMDAKGALIEFDLDLDGVPDVSETYDPATPIVVDWPYTSAGDYKVTMTMTDAVYKKKYKVTKTVHIDAPTVGEPETDASDDGAEKGGAE
jgi:NADH-quinone oxidoreductase subunit L